MSAKVLVIEDEEAISQLLAYNLQKEGFTVATSADGDEALIALDESKPDIVLLDWMLPNVSGIELCRQLRARAGTRDIPVIMLTARGEEEDRVRGLDVGADDYVTKPFSVGELIARIKAIFRRLNRLASDAELLRIGPCEVNVKKHTLARKGKKAQPLTFYEVELLKLLHERAEQPVARDEILDKIWGVQATPSNRSVDNFIVKLRRKLEDDHKKPVHILTVYGYGYKLVP